MTAFGGDVPAGVMPAGIDEKGIYMRNEEGTELLNYRYDGKRETVYELPKEYEGFRVNAISGNSLLMTLITPGQEYQTVGLDLSSKKVTPIENKTIRNIGDFVYYRGICDSVFLVEYGNEEKNCSEVWTFEAMLSENGQPLLHCEKLITETKLPFTFMEQ